MNPNRTTIPMAFLAVLAALPLAAGEPEAAPPPPPPAPVHVTLEEAVTAALEANPGLKALSHRTEAARRDARAAGRTRWGSLDAFFQYTRFNDDWMVRPMSREMFEAAGGFLGLPWDRNQRHYGLRFELPLYMGGELSNGIRIRDLEAESAAALLEGTRWQVRFNAVSLYTAVQTLDQTMQALDGLVAALEKTKERLDLMVSSGKRPELDRLKVVESLEAARARRAGVRADRVRAAALLLALMGRDPSGELETDPLPDRIPRLTVPAPELRTAAKESTAVRRARFAAEQGERGVKVATASFIPHVVASGDLTQNAAPSVDDPLDTWQVSVGVVVPIFHGASRFESLAAAKERSHAAREALAQAEQDAVARLEEALARFEAAKASLAAARARVAAGDEAARIEQIRYDTGAGTIEDLLRARSHEEEAQAGLAAARGGVVTAAERINSIVEKEAVQ